MEKYVRLLGRRSDVASLYTGFDVLLMPSKSEGFPVAAVEAICEGLPVPVSYTHLDVYKRQVLLCPSNLLHLVICRFVEVAADVSCFDFYYICI